MGNSNQYENKGKGLEEECKPGDCKMTTPRIYNNGKSDTLAFYQDKYFSAMIHNIVAKLK